MKLERHLRVLVGILVTGGVLLATSPALAYGPQWRPAQVDDPTLQSMQRLASMPGFRPHSAARPAIAVPSGHRRHAYRNPTVRPGWQPPPVHSGWQGYPQPQGYMPPMAAHQRFPQPLMGGYPHMAWMNPYAGAMPWAQPMPLFTRQFAWRPSGHLWMAQRESVPRPRLTQPRYSARVSPQRGGFRPTAPVYAPARGAWRPLPSQAAVALPGSARPGYPPRVNTAGRFAGNQAVFRGTPGFGHPMPVQRVAGPVPPPASVGRPYWRPQRIAAGVQRRHASPFRPQGYGRKPAPRTAELAARGREGLKSGRGGLPGWATTFRDAGVEESCSWCRGT